MTKRILSIHRCRRCCAGGGPGAGAAGPHRSHVAGVVKLNRAPVSNEVLKVKLPRPVERQLTNGMKLLVVESHRVPTSRFG